MKRFLMLATLAAALCAPAVAQKTAQPPVQDPAQPTTQPPAQDPAQPAQPDPEPIVAPPPAWEGPTVSLKTSMGDIVITLDMAGAPKSAGHFLAMAKSGYFDGAAFYRIEPGFVIQAGDLDSNLKYRPPKTKPVPLETANNWHTRGAVALAHGEDPNSGNATFYIDLSENTGLSATPGAPPNTTGYTVFGHVTSGMEVVDAISKVDLAEKGGPFPGHLPKVPVFIKSATAPKAPKAPKPQ